MLNKKFILFLLIFTIHSVINLCQDLEIYKVEPPNWWAEMKYNNLQLMLYGENLKNLKIWNESNSIKINKIYQTKNYKYAFIDITIPSHITPCNYKFYVTDMNDTVSFTFPVIKRNYSKNSFQGFDSNDIIYLITPDRFCNGDLSNDNLLGMIDQYNPGAVNGRHGGDIQGIISKLDYLTGLGITAIWITPLLENNTKLSYHGYAATDLYKIDPRFGTNGLYKKLVDEAHKRGIKVIYDHVNNHIGLYHLWVKNPPTKDWFNVTTDGYFLTPHQKISLYDSNSPQFVVDSTLNGWFVDEMPDLNQRNPFVANYLIQNTLWWIEYSGLDGIREDTYPYSDQKYLSNWAETIFSEYPNFNIVGEVWIEDATFLAPYQSGSLFNKGFDSNLPSVTDFGFLNAVRKIFAEKQSINNIYLTLAKDFLFNDPSKLLIFVDNHDIERIMYDVKGNTERFKLALKLLFTMRGIPQIYYGTELGMIGGKEHGNIRTDFPGGFPGDKRNAFKVSGRTSQENEIFNFVKNLISIRKNHKVLRTGKFIHIPPANEVYIYFRINEDERIMIVLNNNNYTIRFNLKPLGYILGNTEYFKDLETGEKININESKEITIDGNQGLIYLLLPR